MLPPATERILFGITIGPILWKKRGENTGSLALYQLPPSLMQFAFAKGSSDGGDQSLQFLLKRLQNLKPGTFAAIGTKIPGREGGELLLSLPPCRGVDGESGKLAAKPDPPVPGP